MATNNRENDESLPLFKEREAQVLNQNQPEERVVKEPQEGDRSPENSLAYWQQQLADLPLVLELPTDRYRGVSTLFEASCEPFALDRNLTETLQSSRQQTGNTRYAMGIAAFASLLYRYSGQEDILIGTVTKNAIAPEDRQSNNDRDRHSDNFLVLRFDFAGNPTVVELLEQVRQVTLEAYTHRDLRFDVLVKELQPDADLSRNPLTQVGFGWLEERPNRDRQENESVESNSDASNIQLDLRLHLWEESDSLKGEIIYDSNLLDPATIARMVGHYQVLLAEIAARSQQRIGDLPLLTAAEQHQLLEEWNETQIEQSDFASIREGFERQVEGTPNAIAVIFADRQWTYRELNSRANQLAHFLQNSGVKPEVLVGICMERSLEILIGILGILKAGGAYMALDPNYPVERLALMLEDTQAPVLLTQQGLIDRLPEHNARVVCLDADWDEIARERNENPSKMETQDPLVYVTYTSGSTGKPKGIAMSQRPLVNLLAWQFHHYELTEGMKTLQLASLSFDVSFQEIFSTWLSGGTLVMIPSEALRRDVVGLSRFISDRGIERLFIPAPALRQLAEGFFVHERFPLQLKYAIAGSEQLQIDRAIADLFARVENCSLHNEYGPSETHVVTIFDLPLSSSQWPDRPPIGRPIFNTQIYLLDSHLQPVPIGIPGEVYIGGAGLARGYLNRPDLTAERFIRDWLSENEGAHLYKTGDLARYLPDGNIEYLGRIDHQVKIRGFRIELGEIETVLSQHPQVRETVVIVREDIPSHKRLVAYVVLSRKEPSAIGELRQFLAQKLPDYMIPSAFVLLDILPLTPNRKVDRKALPTPAKTRPELQEIYTAPRTPKEKKLAKIWQQILDLEPIGIDDNFLELGGDSLLATRIIARIRDEFRLDVSLDSLLEEPTIAKQAERIETLHWLAQNQQTAPENLEGDREEGEL